MTDSVTQGYIYILTTTVVVAELVTLNFVMDFGKLYTIGTTNQYGPWPSLGDEEQGSLSLWQ